MNIEDAYRAASMENAKSQWQNYILSEEARPIKLSRSIKTATNYIESAVDKGRKPENIAKRKAELEEKKKELILAEKHIALLYRLEKEADRVYHNTKYVSRGSSYNYQYETEIEFKLDGKHYQFSPMPSGTTFYHGYGRLIESKDDEA